MYKHTLYDPRHGSSVRNYAKKRTNEPTNGWKGSLRRSGLTKPTRCCAEPASRVASRNKAPEVMNGLSIPAAAYFRQRVTTMDTFSSTLPAVPVPPKAGMAPYRLQPTIRIGTVTAIHRKIRHFPSQIINDGVLVVSQYERIYFTLVAFLTSVGRQQRTLPEKQQPHVTRHTHARAHNNPLDSNNNDDDNNDDNDNVSIFSGRRNQPRYARTETTRVCRCSGSARKECPLRDEEHAGSEPRGVHDDCGTARIPRSD